MERIIEAITMAREGVEFDYRNGAACPLCGARLKVISTKPWIVNRIRYHRCENTKCHFYLHPELGNIKSIERPR